MAKTVYWDANVFNALFGREDGRVETCEAIERSVREGNVLIYTSTATFVECVWIKGLERRLNPTHESVISKYFQHKFIRPVICDRQISDSARSLLWKFYPGLKSKDAIHVASALFVGVDVLHTYDDFLIGMYGKIGEPSLTIVRPSAPN